MQSQIKNQTTNQDIIIKNRHRIEITGVKKINSLNEEEFIVETTLGILVITGENLSMSQLEIEKGNLIINGTINCLEYTEKENKKENKGLFKKIFKWFTH